MRPADCANCCVQPLDHFTGEWCPMCGHRIEETP